MILFLSIFTGTVISYAESEDSRPRFYEALLGEFKNPGVDYRPAPLWVWNNTLSKELIDENLKAFKEAGIGAVYIHARMGLQICYLSKEWFKWVDYTLEVARKLGIKVWIYDEYGCPSGFAGGFVPHLMPESYNQGTGLVSHLTDKLDVSIDIAVTRGIFKNVDG